MPRQCKVERLPAEKCAAEDSRQFQKAIFSPRFILRAPVAFSPADTSTLLSPRFLDQHRYLWNIMEFLQNCRPVETLIQDGRHDDRSPWQRRAHLQLLPSSSSVLAVHRALAGNRCCFRLVCGPATMAALPSSVTSFRVKQLRPSTPRQCRDKDAGEPWTPETCCPDSEDESTSEAGSEGFGCGWDLPVTTVVLPMQPGPLLSPAYCPSS